MKKISLTIVFCLIICLAITNIAIAKNQFLGGEIFTLKINQFQRLFGNNQLSKIYFDINIGYAGITGKRNFSLIMYGRHATPYNLFFTKRTKIEIVDDKVIVILKIIDFSPYDITLQFHDAIKLE